MKEICEKYAIIEASGRQFQAVEGKTLELNRLEGEPGDKVTFDKVLLFKAAKDQVKIGQPYVDGVAVQASILKHSKGPKLVVFKFKRRKKYRVKNGHRQPLSIIRFESIA